MTIAICSKSRWRPTARREHAIAASAALDGHPVVFIEAALDARSLMHSRTRRAWLSGLRPAPREVAPGIHALAQATLVPGHHSNLAELIDARRLRRGLRSASGGAHPIVVATQPWQWPAVAAAPASRRVFDCADDWRALIPRRADVVDALHQRIAREADAVILASAQLIDAFPGAAVTVVPNGTGKEPLQTPPSAPPAASRMVYAGTLSERFDAPFLAAVLTLLPDWSVELYGECRYARRGSGTSPELEQLLRAHPDRVRWHGPVERVRLAGFLDRGRVLIAPHRAALSRGQDSMKLYDYAARGRPIVSTPGALGERARVEGAGVIEAATQEQFASAVASADPESSEARRRWAIENRWESRWPSWSEAALGAARAVETVR